MRKAFNLTRLETNPSLSIKMTIPRNQQICLETTRTYHCTSRCVRSSFLCGFDKHTQTDYDHRRRWLEQRLWLAASAYCIKLCSYAIMHNHYHVVLFVDREQALKLTDKEVIERWNMLHVLPALVKKAYEEVKLTEGEEKLVQTTIAEWRERLYSIESFMKDINWYIAKKSNKEDGVTGHFWDGRYRSQSLADEIGLLSAMVYVDLNPVRAGIADAPEASEYTSVQARIKALKSSIAPPCLHPFIDQVSDEDQSHVPMSYADYLELVDWTGRQLRPDKPGHIDTCLPAIFERLNLPLQNWLEVTTNLERPRAIMVGRANKIALLNVKAERKQNVGYRLPD